MNRRGFLKTLSAAFCGAMLSTFPDFAPAREAVQSAGNRFGVSCSNLIEFEEGARATSARVIGAHLHSAVSRFEKFGDR